MGHTSNRNYLVGNLYQKSIYFTTTLKLNNMGFFSWKTQDTDRSICNQYSNRQPFPVVMIDNKGNKWEEYNYEGYGEFGGKDFYELLAEMNGLESDRQKGIDLAYSENPFISPNLVELRSSKSWKWINKSPDNCEFQGFFYDEENNEEEF